MTKILISIFIIISLSSNVYAKSFVGGKKEDTFRRIKVEKSVRFEETGAGNNVITLSAPSSLSSDWTLVLPSNDGDSGEFLSTNGSGTTTWSDVGNTYLKLDGSNANQEVDITSYGLNTQYLKIPQQTDPATGSPLLSIGNGDFGLINIQLGTKLTNHCTVLGINQHVYPQTCSAVNGINLVTSYDGQIDIPGYYGISNSLEVTPGIPTPNDGVRTESANYVADWNISQGTDTDLYMFKGSNRDTSTCTTAYGVYIPDISGVGTNNYTLYGAGGDIYNNGDLSLDGKMTITYNGTGTTTTPAFIIQNTTPATSSGDEFAYLQMIGSAWDGSTSKTTGLKLGISDIWNKYPGVAIYLQSEGLSDQKVLQIDWWGQFKSPIKYNKTQGEYIYPGFYLSGDGSANVSTDRYSPSMRLYSVGWATGGGGSEYMVYDFLNAPEQGTTHPVGVHKAIYGTDTAIPSESNELWRAEWGDRLGMVFNDKSLSGYNFRIEGDTDTNLFFTDGVNDKVGIGTNTPNKKLEINGDIQATDYYSSDGTAGASTTTGGLTFKNGLYTSGSASTVNKSTVVATTTYTVAVDVVFCDTDSSGFTVTMPTGSDGKTVTIINCGSSNNDVTITSSDNMQGSSDDITLVDGESLTLVYNPTQKWWGV